MCVCVCVCVCVHAHTAIQRTFFKANTVSHVVVGLKPSSQYDADLGVMSGASASGVNERSGRPFTIQCSQRSAMMQSIKTTKTKI